MQIAGAPPLAGVKTGRYLLMPEPCKWRRLHPNSVIASPNSLGRGVVLFVDTKSLQTGDFTETERSNAALLRAVPCSYDT